MGQPVLGRQSKLHVQRTFPNQPQRINGTLFWNELIVSPVPNAEGVVTHFVGLAADITERKAMEEQLLHQATHDPLTGLPNRALLLDRISQSIIYAKKSKLLVKKHID